MKFYTKTIAELKKMFKNKQIKLVTPNKRQAFCKAKYKSLLLSSICHGLPISALIFYKNPGGAKAKEVYDVIDGSLRLEIILQFIGEIKLKEKDKLKVEFKNPKTGKKDYLYFDGLYQNKVNKEYENILEKFWQYPIPIIEYENDSSDIFGRKLAKKEIFLRISSTGLPLTINEEKISIGGKDEEGQSGKL